MSMDAESAYASSHHRPHAHHHLMHHNPDLAASLEGDHHFHHHRSASNYAKPPSSISGLDRSSHKNGSLHIKRPNSGGSSQAPSKDLGRSNSNPQKQRPSSTGHATPPDSNHGSPPGSVSGSRRRRGRGDNQQGDPSSSSSAAASSEANFDTKQMQHALESSLSGGHDGASSTSAGNSNSSNDPKKERYRSLWGKVGKHQLAVAQAESAAAAAASGSNPSTPSESNTKKRWDQVLNPLLQKSDKKLKKRTSQLEMPTVVATAYLNQQPSSQQINYMNAPNMSTTQCDCGDDSCQFCNLLLNMEMTDPNMLM